MDIRIENIEERENGLLVRLGMVYENRVEYSAVRIPKPKEEPKDRAEWKEYLSREIGKKLVKPKPQKMDASKFPLKEIISIEEK